MSSTIDPSLSASRWHSLAAQVIEGEALSREDALSVLASDDDELLDLLSATYRVRRQHFGKTVHLYYLRNAKSGLCPEDCTYCSQSKDSEAPIEKYVMQNEEKLLEGLARRLPPTRGLTASSPADAARPIAKSITSPVRPQDQRRTRTAYLRLSGNSVIRASP